MGLRILRVRDFILILLIYSLYGCSTARYIDTVNSGEINISPREFQSKSKNSWVKTKADCIVHIGDNIREVVAPTAVNFSFTGTDKVYVYCTKPGFKTVYKDSKYGFKGLAQLPRNLSQEKFDLITSSRTNAIILSGAILMLPLGALVGMEYFYLAVAGLYGSAVIEGVNDLGKFEYPYQYLSPSLMREEDITEEYSIMDYDPEGAPYYMQKYEDIY